MKTKNKNSNSLFNRIKGLFKHRKPLIDLEVISKLNEKGIKTLF